MTFEEAIVVQPDWYVREGNVYTAGGKVVTSICESSGDQYPLIAHDCAKSHRLNERLDEIGASRVLVSPELAHMLVKRLVPEDVCHDESCPMCCIPAGFRGFTLICDDTLPPNSIVDPTPEAQHLGGD